MYNNYYWNQNQGMMYPNTVPNEDSQYPNPLSYSPNEDFHYQVPTSRNSDIRNRTIELRAVKGTGKQLGDGFERFDWPDITDIYPDEYLTAVMSVDGGKVISGGWAPGGFSPLYALESLPDTRRLDTWIITALNQTPGNPRKISFFLIAKS